MKIAIVTEAYPVDSETFVTQIAEGMAQNGHRVTLLALTAVKEITKVDRQSCLENMTIKWAQPSNANRWHKFTQFVKTIQANGQWSNFIDIIFQPFWLHLHDRLRMGHVLLNLMHERFDVVHVQHGHMAQSVMIFSESGLISGKIVVTWHGSDANCYPLKYGENIYNSLFKKPYIHTVGSNFILSRLLELGAKKEMVEIVPMGVDLVFFKPFTQSKHNRNASPFRIISVGRLSEEKGHIYLLRAVADLVHEGFDLSLTVIGSGPERNRLEEEMHKLDLLENVSLVGAQGSEYIRQELNRASLFALTGVAGSDGRVESQGVVFAEAQAMGLPIVSSNIGGIPESVLHGETGFLCEPASVKQISNAIRKLILDPSLRNSLSRNARRFVEQKYDKQKMICKFESIYSK